MSAASEFDCLVQFLRHETKRIQANFWAKTLKPRREFDPLAVNIRLARIKAIGRKNLTATPPKA